MTTNGTCGSRDVSEVVLGVDTHLDFHVAVVLDILGRRLGESKIPTTLKGYRNLLRWAEGFGTVRCAGVEGTGSYGAGLAPPEGRRDRGGGGRETQAPPPQAQR